MRAVVTDHRRPGTSLAVFVCLMLGSGTASAQDAAFCQELWLSRNTVMDRAGQCFTSSLGRAVFDNGDCVDGNIRLNPLDAEIVRLVQETEVWANCDVDIDADQLAVGALRFQQNLMFLFTVPVRRDSEQMCSGYRGAPVSLYTGISTDTTLIGTVWPGQDVTSSHHPMRGGWEYLEASAPDGTPLAYGWAQGFSDDRDLCAFSAG